MVRRKNTNRENVTEFNISKTPREHEITTVTSLHSYSFALFLLFFLFFSFFLFSFILFLLFFFIFSLLLFLFFHLFLPFVSTFFPFVFFFSLFPFLFPFFHLFSSFFTFYLVYHFPTLFHPFSPPSSFSPFFSSFFFPFFTICLPLVLPLLLPFSLFFQPFFHVVHLFLIFFKKMFPFSPFFTFFAVFPFSPFSLFFPFFPFSFFFLLFFSLFSFVSSFSFLLFPFFPFFFSVFSFFLYCPFLFPLFFLFPMFSIFFLFFFHIPIPPISFSLFMQGHCHLCSNMGQTGSQMSDSVLHPNRAQSTPGPCEERRKKRKCDAENCMKQRTTNMARGNVVNLTGYHFSGWTENYTGCENFFLGNNENVDKNHENLTKIATATILVNWPMFSGSAPPRFHTLVIFAMVEVGGCLRGSRVSLPQWRALQWPCPATSWCKCHARKHTTSHHQTTLLGLGRGPDAGPMRRAWHEGISLLPPSPCAMCWVIPNSSSHKYWVAVKHALTSQSADALHMTIFYYLNHWWKWILFTQVNRPILSSTQSFLLPVTKIPYTPIHSTSYCFTSVCHAPSISPSCLFLQTCPPSSCPSSCRLNILLPLTSDAKHAMPNRPDNNALHFPFFPLELPTQSRLQSLHWLLFSPPLDLRFTHRNDKQETGK